MDLSSTPACSGQTGGSNSADAIQREVSSNTLGCKTQHNHSEQETPPRIALVDLLKKKTTEREFIFQHRRGFYPKDGTIAPGGPEILI